MVTQPNQFTPKVKLVQVPEVWIMATAIAGMVAGTVFQQVLLSTVPFSLSVMMAQANRRSSEQRLERSLNAQGQQVQLQLQELQSGMVLLQQSTVEQDTTEPLYTRQRLAALKDNISRLQRKYQELELKQLKEQQQELDKVATQLNALAEQVKVVQQQVSALKRAGQVPTGSALLTHAEDHVAILVDASNLYHCAGELGLKVNYEQLLPRLHSGFKYLRILFYTGVRSSDQRQRRFIALLKQQGYEVITKEVVRYQNGQEKANLDVEMALHLVALSAGYHHLILLSGDGDLACAVKAAQLQGARVEVAGFRSRTSKVLIRAADQFHDLTPLVKVSDDPDNQGNCMRLAG